MAAIEEHARLLPSPPPSPPRQRKHNKKKSDPFFDLATTPLPSPSAPSSPANEPEEPQESLVTRIILTPLLFTSFLLSLFLVNHRDRVRRTNSSPTTSNSISSSLLSYLPLTSSLWIDPEPYQDPSSTTWTRRDSNHVEPHSVLSNADDHTDTNIVNENRDTDRGNRNGTNKRKSWHLHKKIRKVAKLEISDAFEMRGRVIMALLFGLFMGTLGFILGIRWMLVRMF